MLSGFEKGNIWLDNIDSPPLSVLFPTVLSKAWLTKSLYNELWVYIYSKGWGDPWHSPLWQFIYPHDSSSTLWLLHPTIDTWTSTWQGVTLQCTCVHVRQNGLSKPCKISLTLGLLWWDQLFDMLVMVKVVSWCQAWSSVMVCTRSMVTSCWSKLLPPLHLGALVWILHPTSLLACTWSSWVRMNRQHTDA